MEAEADSTSTEDQPYIPQAAEALTSGPPVVVPVDRVRVMSAASTNNKTPCLYLSSAKTCPSGSPYHMSPTRSHPGRRAVCRCR